MNKYPIELIVAATPDGEIGYDNTIPWKLSGDLQRFKRLTMGNYVIIGRNTLQSLPNALPGRKVVVVSKTLSDPRSIKQRKMDIIAATMAPHYVHNLLEALIDITLYGFSIDDAVQKKIFIAGGARLYEEAIQMAVEGTIDLTVHLTTVYKDPHTPGYDTRIKNFGLLDQFEVLDHPEEVYDEVYQHVPEHIDPGLWYMSEEKPKPRLISRTLSHTYTTLKMK